MYDRGILQLRSCVGIAPGFELPHGKTKRMPEHAANRDLLFALTALQNGLINQAQLVAAFQAWTLAKAVPLADHLGRMGHLDAEGRSAIDALVALHLKRHGGSTEKSLADFRAGRSTRDALAEIHDLDVDATLSLVGSGTDLAPVGESEFTASYVLGEANSGGERFRVLRPHAQGGLGAVYVAMDSELNREVALKRILDPHADDPNSRQRFLLEAQVTGGLEHPGIVPVYGLGVYRDGRPYYAMRFIKGDSLKQAIERFHADANLRNDPGRRSLEMRHLLRRFTDVCNAIAYAHSRGVLHRDIKPGNVIIGKYGETLVVDWGLAKALGKSEPGSASPERTLLPLSGNGKAETIAGIALGTPAYMSPEQASGDMHRLGPRSDVYSLGATLYCLLTGRPPFEGDAGEVLAAVRDGRFALPRALDRSIDPALEAVCQRAMATLPEDRYVSCRALADDIDRWMADEPVTARRAPLAERARRWMRRRRTLVTAVAVAASVALAGLAVVLAVQAQAHRDLLAANGRLSIAIERETGARAQSERRFALAREAIEAFYTGASEDVLLKEPQLDGLRNKLLGSSLDFYKKLQQVLDAEPGAGPRDELATAYERVSALTEQIGSQTASIEAARRALQMRENLAREHPDAEIQSSLANAQSRLGSLLSEAGQTEAALRAMAQARSTEENLARDQPGVSRYQAELAKIHDTIGTLLGFRLGRNAEGLREHSRATEILEAELAKDPTPDVQRALATAYQNLGMLRSVAGSPHDALAAYDRCLAVGEQLCRAHPEVAEFRNALAVSHNNAGTSFCVNGQIARAVDSFRRSLSLCEQLSREHPTSSRYRSGVAVAHQSIGWAFGRASRAGLPR